MTNARTWRVLGRARDMKPIGAAGIPVPRDPAYAENGLGQPVAIPQPSVELSLAGADIATKV